MSLVDRAVWSACLAAFLVALGATAAGLPAPPGHFVRFRSEDSAQDSFISLTGTPSASATYAEGKVLRGILLGGSSGFIRPATVLSARSIISEREPSLVNNQVEHRVSAAIVTVGLAGDIAVDEPAIAEFEVLLNAPTTKTVSVTYSTVSGSALAGVDFESQAGVLEFLPGTVRQTIRVPVFRDGWFELDESFRVELSSAVNAALGTSTATGTIASVEPSPVARVRPIRRAEGNSGPIPFRFEVTLDRPSGLTSSVRYATTNDTAKAPTDYSAVQGTLTFAPGETNAGIEVMVNGDTAVESNETFFVAFSEISGFRFPTMPPALAVGTILNDDAVAGLVTEFVWDPLPTDRTTGEAMPAGLTARDGAGVTVPGFSGVIGIQAFAGPGLPSSVVMTEVSIASIRGVELQNVSPEPVDVSGWVVYFYDASRWPAPRATFTLPQGTEVKASAVFTVEASLQSSDPGTYPRFRLNQALQWANRDLRTQATIGVVVTDTFGRIQDSFFAGNADAAEVGVPEVLTSENWLGRASYLDHEISGYSRRQGQERNARRATDWIARRFPDFGGLGRPNFWLKLPFVDAVALPVAPEAVSGFTEGRWSGDLTLNGFAPQVRFLADDGNGHRGLSAPVLVHVVDDLQITMEVQPRVLTAPSWASDFVITATNHGPVLSSNVTAQVLLAPEYGRTSSAVSNPQVSQGKVRLHSIGSEIGGLRAAITAAFGDLPAGGSATLTFSTRRPAYGIIEAPANLESVVTLTREPMELNPVNNREIVVQEFSTPCAPLGSAAVAWWRAEGGFNDSLNGLSGTPEGGAVLGEGRVGTGGFRFDGVDDAVRVPDYAFLDFGATDSFSIESWVRCPPETPENVVLLGKVAPAGGVLTGYILSLEGGFLAMDLGDGENAIHLQFGTLGSGAKDLRDGRWHHVAVTANRDPAIRRVLAWADGIPFSRHQNPSLFLGSLANDGPLVFGQPLPGGPEARFAGDLDEIVFHRRALSAGEVQAAYAAGAHGRCASEFQFTPVAPHFDAQPGQWISQDSGVAGRPYRFHFNLTNGGPLTGEASIRVSPLGFDTHLTLVTPSGPVAFDPQTFETRAFLGPLAPGMMVPLSVTVVSTNPVVTLSLLGSGSGLSSGASNTAVQINLAADSDQDGIPDSVELASGLNPMSAADAATDQDGDGFTAAQEFEAGTAANDTASALRLRVESERVVFDALASRVYRLERRDLLESGSWSLIQTIRPETGVISLGPLGEAGAGYYRVWVSLPY